MAGTTLKLNVQGLDPQASDPQQQIPQAPPPPPPPLNFAQFASNPLAQQKVSAMVPGLPPPPPPQQMASAGPPPPTPPARPSPAPSSAPAPGGAQPQLTPPPNFQQWQQQNPNQQEKPMSGLMKALQVAAGIIHGGAPGGVAAGQAIHQHDLPAGLTGIDQQRYQQQVMQPYTAQLQAADVGSQIKQRESAAEKSTAQADALPQQIQAKKNQILAQLAAKGQTGTFDDTGNLTGVADDPNSAFFKKQQAQTEYFQSRQDLQTAQAELARSRNDPTSPAYKQAQSKVNAELQRVAVAEQALGLSSQRLGFEQDKFYNPQPTGTQRTKGDLAQSALERVQEMKGIIAKRPDIFGPGAGRATKAQVWLGSQDPDAQTYQSAAAYLAEHSAGVFGGRGKYIIEGLHGLTDPHSNPAALNAALDEAEKASRGFAVAGQLHHAPVGNPPSNNAPSTSGGYTKTATGPGGHKIGLKGGKWYDVQTGAAL